jgi:hypothetical protein
MGLQLLLERQCKSVVLFFAFRLKALKCLSFQAIRAYKRKLVFVSVFFQRHAQSIFNIFKSGEGSSVRLNFLRILIRFFFSYFPLNPSRRKKFKIKLL